jgi:hypothetical protein
VDVLDELHDNPQSLTSERLITGIDVECIEEVEREEAHLLDQP